MKLGTSYSRCVRDIVDGQVHIEDILVIIDRTDFNPHDDEQWASIWNGYRTRNGWTAPEWADYADSDEDMFRQISIDLYDLGKLHQPRRFGGSRNSMLRSPYVWLEVSLTSEDIASNPTVQAAWEQFQIVAGLVGGAKAFNDDF